MTKPPAAILKSKLLCHESERCNFIEWSMLMFVAPSEEFASRGKKRQTSLIFSSWPHEANFSPKICVKKRLSYLATGYKDFKARLASIWNNLVPRAHAPLQTTRLENFLPSFSQS